MAGDSIQWRGEVKETELQGRNGEMRSEERENPGRGERQREKEHSEHEERKETAVERAR